MAGYKLATYQSADGPRAGLVIDDKVFDAAKLTGKPAMRPCSASSRTGGRRKGVLKKAAAAKAAKSKVKASRSRAPSCWRRCCGPRRSIAQVRTTPTTPPRWRARMNRPLEPDPHTQGLKAWHFIKAARALADPGATVKISGVSDRVDWEVELAAVIGRPAKNVPEDEGARLCRRLHRGQRPLGARPRTPRANISDTSPFKADWTKHKTFDGSCPLGPWIVPASDIGDPRTSASSSGSTTFSSRIPTART